jgi:hypothetical protein
LARAGVDLLAVAELFSQAWADQEPVFQVDAEVSAVVERRVVRSQKQAVVESVFAAGAERPDVRCLQDLPDFRR